MNSLSECDESIEIFYSAKAKNERWPKNWKIEFSTSTLKARKDSECLHKNNGRWWTCFFSILNLKPAWELWQYRLSSFWIWDTKLERFLPKNQHTQRKLLNFENWCNGEVSKSALIWLSKLIFYFKNHRNLSQFFSLKEHIFYH